MKKERKKLNNETDELKSLGSELGTFGLEPPKIYRPEQKEKIHAAGKKTVEKVKRIPKKQKKQKKELTRKELAKKRQQKKKLRLALSIVAVVLALAIVILILSLTVFFKIDTITIKGNEKYTNKQITAVLPIEKEKNLFVCDTDKAAEKLEKNLPYIYSVDIKRKLPSTIIVNITEPQTVYSIKNKDKTYTLLDDNFKVLEANIKKLPKKTVVIDKIALSKSVPGETAEFTNKKAFDNLKALTDIVKTLNIKNITSIYSVDVNNNYLVYDGRIVIKIGSIDDIENKMYSALATIDKLSETNPQAVGELTSMGGKQVYFTEQK